MLYGLLTGRPAFDAREVPLILTQVIRHDPPRPSSLAPDLPPAVDHVVARALAKAPGDRYQSGQAFADAIEDVLAGRPLRHGASRQALSTPGGRLPSAERPPVIRSEAAPSGPRWTQRRGLGALGVVLVLGLGAFAWWQRRASDAPLPPSPATTLAPAPSAAPSAASMVPPETATPPPQTSPEPARDPAPGLVPPARRPAREAGVPSSERAVESTREASPEAPADTARLLIDFEHPLKSGTMRLWLDERLVLEEDLEGRVKRKVAGLKWRSGGFEKELVVPPGRHTLRAQVSWEDNDKTDSILGTLEPGEVRRVEIRVGRLRKNVSVEWK